MRILAIETSCDETAVAVVEKTNKGLVRVLGEAVASSEEMHVKTGGVVPEVAAREQLASITAIVKEALSQVGVKKGALDAVAVTVGPGLIGSLLVGVETAKTLALAWNKPLIPVNHLVGHVYGNWVGRQESPPEFPGLGLVVSGGHTELLLIDDHGKMDLLGTTRDDAAGECFDKCARLLGLGYPGGPKIAAEAAKHHVANNGNEVKLPRPLLKDTTYDFSFSGLKIAVLREIRKEKTKDKVTIAYELQEAVVDCLLAKLRRAIKEFKPKSVLVAGGVAANVCLRNRLVEECGDRDVKLFVPEVKYCTDNAAMVGAAAMFHYSPIAVEKAKADPSLEVVD